MTKYLNLKNLKNIFRYCGYEIMCNHACALVHQHLAREQGTSLHVPLFSASSVFDSMNKHTFTHFLDNSVPTFTDVFPLRHTQTHTHYSSSLSLSGSVTRC